MKHHQSIKLKKKNVNPKEQHEKYLQNQERNAADIKDEKFKNRSQELEAIIDAIPELVFYKDTENNFIYVNKFGADAYKLKKSEINGKNLFDLHTKEQAQAYWDDDLAVINSGKPKLNIEERWETEKGKVWVNTSKIPYFDEEGVIKGIVGISIDITDRKKAEGELENYHYYLEEMIKARTKELNCLYQLSEITNEKNMTLTEILKKAVEILPPAFQYPELACARINFEGENYETKNFKDSDLELVSDVILLGSKVGFVKICYREGKTQIGENPFLKGEKMLINDVAERLGKIIESFSVEEEIAIQYQINNVFLTVPDEEMYNEVLKIVLTTMQSKFGVFGYIDDNGALIIPSMIRYIGDQCQVPDKTFTFPREIWGNSIWPRVINQKEILYSNEISYLTPKGHIKIKRNISAPIIHKGEVIGLFQVANKATDYNESDIKKLENVINQIAPILNVRLQKEFQEKMRKVAEENLRKTLEDLKRSNAELEQFASIASHDLQEPLRMVANFTQLLQKRYQDKLDQDANDFINYAVDGTKRMQKLINDLLTFSRVGKTEKPFKSTDLNIIFEQVQQNLSQSIQEKNAIISCDPLPVVMADESQMLQLLQNLISNAIKFNESNPPKIHVSGEVRKDEWLFSVQDNGIGIDPQYFNKLFVIFQRLNPKDQYGGSGIGLAVCKKIILRHGGKIWLESQPNKGTTFFFTISAPKNEI